MKDILKNIKALRAGRAVTQKEVDKVLAKRSTGSRARAAYNLWLKLNPMCQVSFSDGTSGWLPAQRIHNLSMEKVKILRDNQKNRFGTNESKSMRHGLEMPPAALNFIQLFHPDIFDSDDYAKTRFRKLMKEFSEFRVLERI